MAKILLSAFLTDIRKKTSSTVFSKNRYGNHFGVQGAKVGQSSEYQRNSRIYFELYSRQWATLTDVERQSWINGAINFPYTDKFGELRTLSGFNLYCQLNQNNYLVAGGDFQTCPSYLAPSTMVDTVFTANRNPITGLHELIISTGFASNFQNTRVALYATEQVSVGRMSNKLNYYFMKYYTAADETTNFTSEYNTYIGKIESGRKIFVKAVPIETLSGVRGVETFVSAITAP